MWDRLEQIGHHYEELSQQMARPEIATDPKQLQALAREKASIEDLVTKYRQYKATSKELEKTKAMLAGRLDEDMSALVKQEIEKGGVMREWAEVPYLPTRQYERGIASLVPLKRLTYPLLGS